MLVACCSADMIMIAGDRIETSTILDRDVQRDGNLIFYTLPDCCLPEKRKQEGLLPNQSQNPIYSGLDAMVLDQFNLLKDRRFAVLTNSTGRDYKLERGLELMIAHGKQPELLLEPEHGLYGHQDSVFRQGVRYDLMTNAKVLSLYSKNRKPPKKYLQGLDLIVVDIKNLPVRCYTYISTLTYVMEAAAESGIEIMILDRSHPYVFFDVAGSQPLDNYRSFVADADLPFLYSMTPGEYATYLQDTRLTNLKLSIVKVSNFSYDSTDTALSGTWINPSPNIPSYESALVYPGVVFLEGVYFSLGRGTTRPFTWSGAPWMDSALVLSRLNTRGLKGVQFSQIKFIANSSFYKDRTSHGIQITPVTTEFDPMRTGYEYIRILRHLYPAQFHYRKFNSKYFMDMLWGGPGYRQAIEKNISYDEFKETWKDDAEAFAKNLEKYRLYD